jgi:hypothetical protein
MEQQLVRKGWVVVLHSPPLPPMKSQVYRSKRAAEQAATERIMTHPELIGRITVERDEEKILR